MTVRLGLFFGNVGWTRNFVGKMIFGLDKESLSVYTPLHTP